MAIRAYIRVSTDKQDVRTQRHEILEFAPNKKWHVDQFIEVEMSSRRSLRERRIEYLLDRLDKGDSLLVSELSRIGRSTAEVILVIDRLLKKGVRIICIKNGLDFQKKDMATKVMITIFGLLAELERDMVSERTKMGLARVKAAGVKLGRPKGPGKSRLDPQVDQIKVLLGQKVSKAAIGRIFGVHAETVRKFVKSRKL